jgi:hypothetical protein
LNNTGCVSGYEGGSAAGTKFEVGDEEVESGNLFVLFCDPAPLFVCLALDLGLAAWPLDFDFIFGFEDLGADTADCDCVAEADDGAALRVR